MEQRLARKAVVLLHYEPLPIVSSLTFTHVPHTDSRNPQFLPSFQPDPNRLDVYLGVPYHTTTIAGLNHTLQGGWLGWISYHDGLSYRDACGMISSQLPVSRDVFPIYLSQKLAGDLLQFTRNY